jgi:hypothetical protein
MASTTSFRDLDVWQEAMTLVEEIYAVSKLFPRDEIFGLTAQIRKAAVSVPSNIGEGSRRKKRGVRLNHFGVGLTRRSGSPARDRKTSRVLQRF